MEHDEKPLPIDIRLLGALAEKVCVMYFLRYPTSVLFESSIHLIFLGNGAIFNFAVPCFCQSFAL